ncbi:MAG TPA: Uma2 family endonuclease [Solirubrobacteraceae bacterium]|nr:Uma2 family endonuclease [Solirubrobacteraceae bacterium]
MPASSTVTAAAAEPGTELPIHRLDVDTYNKIVASGALEGQRVELLDGVLVEMSPHSPAHGTLIERLTSHFAATGMALRVQLPIEVGPDSEPEPDLALLAERPAPTEHPRTALLVVEVAVSSQKTDRDTKGALYARAAIPTYWLVDVPARAIEVYTEPGDGGYGARELISGKDKLRCALAGVTDIDLALLFEGIEG